MGVGQPGSQQGAEGGGKPAMAQHYRIQVPGKQRFAPGHRAGFVAERRP
jgi:hypothetical protein